MPFESAYGVLCRCQERKATIERVHALSQGACGHCMLRRGKLLGGGGGHRYPSTEWEHVSSDSHSGARTVPHNLHAHGASVSVFRSLWDQHMTAPYSAGLKCGDVLTFLAAEQQTSSGSLRRSPRRHPCRCFSMRDRLFLYGRMNRA